MASNSCLLISLQLFFFFLVFSDLCLGARNLGTMCIDSEREALLAVKKGLTDLSGRLSSWTGEDCCHWEGIECSKEKGAVIKLDLRNPLELIDGIDGNEDAYKRSCLGGKIDPSLLRLESLSYLDLSNNNFKGLQIPEFFGELKNLQYLNLSFASFSGLVPPHLGNLSRLQVLDVGQIYEKLYAESLDWISHLSSLKYLKFSYVSLDDVRTDWLQRINEIPSLVELRLPLCNPPTPSISTPLFNLTSLSVVDLSFNIYSSIPSWLFNLTNLRELYLGWNYIKGPVPLELTNLKSLEVLDLRDNFYLEGQIVLFASLPKLKALDLSGDRFGGEIQEFMDSITQNPNNSLEYLDLSENKFEGTIPQSIGMLKRLKLLSLASNSFRGPLPTSIGKLSNLAQLDLVSNYLNGTIPEVIGQLAELTQLILGNNAWEGVLRESHFTNLRKLKLVSLHTTVSSKPLGFDFSHGWVPPFKLRTLLLDNCLVGPAFPMWLQSQDELHVINVKNSQISDTFPEEWMSKLSPKLTELVLSHNQIKGQLPQGLRFPKLTIFNVSYNNLFGRIPPAFKKFRPSAFKGNPLLCGDPLPRKCESIDKGPRPIFNES